MHHCLNLNLLITKDGQHGLKKAGYATNPNYAHKLIDLDRTIQPLKTSNNEAIARMNGKFSGTAYIGTQRKST